MSVYQYFLKRGITTTDSLFALSNYFLFYHFGHAMQNSKPMANDLATLNLKNVIRVLSINQIKFDVILMFPTTPVKICSTNINIEHYATNYLKMYQLFVNKQLLLIFTLNII